jgi:nuclear pore complex protein Nup85
VGEVIDEMPPDPTNVEDMIHSALFSGQPEQALKYASQLDPWLAAHMADIMVLLDLLDSEISSEYVDAPSAP